MKYKQAFLTEPGHSLNPMDDMRRAFEELESKPAGFLKGLVYPS